MKLVPEGELLHGARIKSEGKILEVTPLLYDVSGQMTALPPVQYHCPNWILGFEDYHVQGYPYNMNMNYREYIQGTRSNQAVGLSFMIRVYEYNPDMVPETMSTIPAEWTDLFAQSVKRAVQEALNKNG